MRGGVKWEILNINGDPGRGVNEVEEFMSDEVMIFVIILWFCYVLKVNTKLGSRDVCGGGMVEAGLGEVGQVQILNVQSRISI